MYINYEISIRAGTDYIECEEGGTDLHNYEGYRAHNLGKLSTLGVFNFPKVASKKKFK